MTTEKRKTPYQHLMERFKEYVNACDYRHRKVMFTYPKDGIDKDAGYSLNKLRERVLAAQQLGYDVELEVFEGALIAVYRKKLPDRPYDI